MQAGCDMRIDRGIVFVLTVLLPASIQGAAEEAAGDAMQEQEETEQAVRESAEEGSSARGGPEVFLPTEEISEDYAAPFPVDI